MARLSKHADPATYAVGKSVTLTASFDQYMASLSNRSGCFLLFRIKFNES
jgi:hypothetical protein